MDGITNVEINFMKIGENNKKEMPLIHIHTIRHEHETSPTKRMKKDGQLKKKKKKSDQEDDDPENHCMCRIF